MFESTPRVCQRARSRPAKPHESVRAQVAREMLQFLAECVWGKRTLAFSIMVRHMAEFTDELTKVEGARFF